MQKNLKLISCRINPDTLDQIDAFTENRAFWTRNTVINRVLSSVFRNFSDRQIYDMVRQNEYRPEPVICDFKIVDLMKINHLNDDDESK